MSELITWQDYDASDPDRCVWCRAPGCTLVSVEVVHLAVCPQVTGLWPFHPQLQGEMQCAVEACSHVFAAGELYATVADPQDPEVGIVVCVPCSLLNRAEAWQ